MKLAFRVIDADGNILWIGEDSSEAVRAALKIGAGCSVQVRRGDSEWTAYD